MGWLQLKLKTSKLHVDYISDLLLLAGAVAITFEDAADEPLFEPTPGTTPLWEQTKIVGLFDVDCDLQQLLPLLQKELSESEFSEHSIELLPDQDWVRAWMQHFHPMQFGKNLWICPSWCQPPVPEAVNILLDPGLAFGTGTHATTALCLEWLDAHPPRNEIVLDYGCGSGILAIAALKLGAKQVWAVDIDPQALTATRDNGLKNQCDATQLKTVLPSELQGEAFADNLLANILAGPLIELAPVLAKYVKSQGKLVLCGILEPQANSVLEAYSPWFDMKLAKVVDGWARLEGSKKA